MSSGGGSRYNDSKNKTQTSAKTAEIDPKKKKEEALNFLNCKHSVQNLEHKNCKKPRLPWRPLGAGEKKFVSKTDPKPKPMPSGDQSGEMGEQTKMDRSRIGCFC